MFLVFSVRVDFGFVGEIMRSRIIWVAVLVIGFGEVFCRFFVVSCFSGLVFCCLLIDCEIWEFLWGRGWRVSVWC